MTVFLKESTSIDIRVGPFLDVTDGFTPEVGVSIASSDEAEILKANGAGTVAMTGTLAPVTGCDGWYDYTLAAGDVDTVGELVIVMQDDSVYLPVFVRAYVIETNIYVSLFASGASAFDASANVTVAGHTAQTGDSFARIGAAGASLTDLGGMSTGMKAEVNAEADTAATDYGALKPTTAGRDLDVTATGAAGINWANVENPTTALDLSGTDIQLCDTVTTNTDVRGTDSAALASVCTEVRLAELDAANLPTDVAAIPTTAMRGTDGVDTATMRGTDSAALASVCTEVRLAELDAANLPSDVDAVLLDTGTNIPATLAALNDLAAADVLTQVNAALDTAIAELGVGVPAVTPTIRTALMAIYMKAVNIHNVKTSYTTDALEVAKADGTIIFHKDITDDTVDYSEAQAQSGAGS